MKRNHSCVLVLPVLLGLISQGCSNSGPPLVPVHGRVTLDGRPLAGKTLKFLPEPGTPGQGAGATTNSAGEYSLLAARPGALRDYPGAPPGMYRVVVVEPMFPVDLPVQSADDPTPTPAIGPKTPSRKKQEIPSRYSNPETTTLKVEVPTGGGELNLPLESAARK